MPSGESAPKPDAEVDAWEVTLKNGSPPGTVHKDLYTPVLQELLADRVREVIREEVQSLLAGPVPKEVPRMLAHASQEVPLQTTFVLHEQDDIQELVPPNTFDLQGEIQDYLEKDGLTIDRDKEADASQRSFGLPTIGATENIFDRWWGSLGTASFTWLRSLRLFRVVKTLRILKLASYFNTLRVMIECCTSSILTFLWSVLMLVVANLMGALVMVSRLSTFLHGDPEVDEDTLEQLKEWFGTVYIAMENFLFASTGSTSWSDYYTVLKEMQTFDHLIYLLIVLFIQLGVLNIILGIFVDSALKALDIGPIEKAEEHAEHEEAIKEVLEKILKTADADGSGRLTLREFEVKISGRVCKFLNMLGFRRDHVRSFLKMLDAKDPTKNGVDIEEFVQGCMLLKGNASNWDVASLRRDLYQVKRLIADTQQSVAAAPPPCSAQPPQDCTQCSPRETPLLNDDIPPELSLASEAADTPPSITATNIGNRLESL